MAEDMNTIPSDAEPDESWWNRPEFAAALAERNITRLYRLLQKQGLSQQRIAAYVGQSQPEVSAIIHGRQVQAYDVLARICGGLGIPRPRMGLGTTADCPTTENARAADPPVSGVGEKEASSDR